jgi:thiol-disulfide isomerase/thioredoxin
MNKLILFIAFLVLPVSVFSQWKPLTVYIAISEECPVCIFMTKSLRELQSQYGDSVDFKLIFPTALSNYKSISQFKNKYKLTNFETILDENQSLTKQLELTITPEVVLISNDGNIIYKGRINDSFISPGKSKKSNITNDLQKAIDLWLANKEKLPEWKNAVGCYITFR